MNNNTKYSSYYIPSVLDAEETVFFFTKDEAAIAVLCCGLGMMLSHTVIGMIAALLVLKGWKKIRGDNLYVMQARLYWHFPLAKFYKLNIPPSHYRFFIGR